MTADWVLLILAAGAGGLGRRLAGGLLGQWTGWQGTTQARLAWALISAVIALGAMSVGWHDVAIALAFGVSIFIGSTYGYGLPWLGNTETTMRMGRGPKGVGFFWPQFAKDFALMSVHGFVGTAPGAAIAMYAGHVSWWTLLAAGLMAAPCYALAWLFPWDIPMLGCYADSTKYDPPPTAELLWGAYVGGATVLAFS